MLDGPIEPVLAGPDVEVVARIVTYLGTSAEGCTRRGVRGSAAIEVRDLHEDGTCDGRRVSRGR